MCTHQNLSIKPAIFEKKINHAFILDPQNIKQIITTETHKRTLTKKKKKKKIKCEKAVTMQKGHKMNPHQFYVCQLLGQNHWTWTNLHNVRLKQYEHQSSVRLNAYGTCILFQI